MSNQMTSRQWIENILGDPTTSFWLKNAIKTLMDRDVIDASKDATILCKIMQKRLEESRRF